jgi:hypothetical protein
MKIKIFMLSIGVTILLLLTFFPNIKSYHFNTYDETSLKQISSSNLIKKGPDTILMNIYHIKKDKNIEKTTKELTQIESENLMNNLTQTEKSESTLETIFEKKLGILKAYELVSDDTDLEDIVDVDKLGDDDDGDVVEGENFSALFAPILFVGIGFGFGLGASFLLTHGTFLLAIAGLGFVFCKDIEKNITYRLQTFLFPVLLGFLFAYTGLFIFGVIRGVFYSNLVGIGMAAYTGWTQIGIPSNKQTQD